MLNNKSKSVARIIVFIFCLFVFTEGKSQDISVTASVNQTVVPLNQPFTLTLTITGSQSNFSGVPSLPPLPDFAITGGTSTSSSIQIVNGRMTTSQSFNYTLIPNKVGKLTIGSLSLRIRGKDYKTDPIIIEVVQSPSPPSQKQPQQQPGEIDLNQDLFILPAISKKTAYSNEGVLISYKLYTRVDIAEYGISRAPSTTGFWAEEYPMTGQPQVKTEIYNGRQFQVATIKEMVVFPTRAGELTIQPLIVEMNVRIKARSNKDFFDTFFDDAFLGKIIRKTVSSGPVTLKVQPLPMEGKPQSFANAVGKFRFTAALDKKEVMANEAITLKVVLSGAGNIKLLEEPKLVFEGEMEQYAPKINTQINRGPTGVSGEKTFEYVLIPRAPGIKQIKSMEFSYFDPEKGKYVTVATPEISINVTKGSTMISTLPSNLTREEVKLLGQDVRFIKAGTPKWISTEVHLFRGISDVVILIFPFVLVGASFIYRRRLDRLSNDRGYARALKAYSTAQKHLKAADKSLGDGQKEQFIIHITDALHGFIADKLNLDVAGLISDEVTKLLQERALSPELVSSVSHCLQMCDYSRFAPSNQEKDDLIKLLDMIRNVMTEVEKQLKS